TVPNVTIRPSILHDPNLADSERSVYRWFDLSAFGPPGPGTFGTSAKGVIVGPGTFAIDSGVAKNFAFTENGGVRLRLEFTGTNILNHPNWGNPGLTINTAASAGIISSTASGGGGVDPSGARSFRAGARLEW